MRPAADLYHRFCFSDEPANGSAAWTPLRDMQTAAMMGDLNGLSRLLDQKTPPILDKDLLSQHDAAGYSLIHHACLSANVEVVMLLLDKGADPCALTATKATALHIAAYNGRDAICKLLLLRGADVDAVDDSGLKPIDDARYMRGAKCACNADTAEQQNGKVAALLQRAMKCKSRGEVADFARKAWELHVSAELQGALEEAEASPQRKRRTPDAMPTLPCFSRLLQRHRGYIDARDYDGSTALHAAARSGQVEAVKLLLANGAEVDCTTNCGERALDFAAREGHTAVAELLIASRSEVVDDDVAHQHHDTTKRSRTGAA